jgi:hypothetical protein
MYEVIDLALLPEKVKHPINFQLDPAPKPIN